MANRILQLSLCAFFIATLSGCAAAVLDDTVQVEQGQLRGVAGTDPSVKVFKGIPFAAPPVGDLRWAAPQPAAAWEGVREADAFGASCIQNVLGSRLPWSEEFMTQNEVSEDCLNLNVWTAAESPDEQRPVLVYIYGGGFNEGSNSVAVYDGEELAKKGLVVVTVNYRVGNLGFFTHPELTQESEHSSSGNYGLLDQLAALQWVQQNIAAFGGDPGNVTIAGQSAGAMSVHYLTASPLAQGLFHRAITQSDVGRRGAGQLLATAEQNGVRFAEAKGAASLAELRAMPVDSITAPIQVEGPPPRFGPVVDGWFLPEDVMVIFAQGRQNDVPTMTGLTADEGSSSPTYGKAPAAQFQQQARQRYNDQADAFLSLYPAASDEEAGRSQVESARDQGLASMYLWAAERAETSQSPSYTYYFDRAIPWPEQPQFGAFHTSEVPYVFNNLGKLDRPWEPADRQLAETMSSYWVNFATNGDPNGEGLPEWPAFDAANPVTMRLGEQVAPRPVADEAKLAFFRTALSRPPAM